MNFSVLSYPPLGMHIAWRDQQHGNTSRIQKSLDVECAGIFLIQEAVS